jgi:hypothetical protein
MTLTEYDANLPLLPTYQRFAAAGPSAKLHELLTTGEAFVPARDRIVGMRQYYTVLAKTGQLSNFASLTGP